MRHAPRHTSLVRFAAIVAVGGFAALGATVAVAPAEAPAPATPAQPPPPKPLMPPKAQTGVASFYGPGLAGKPTATGEPLKPGGLTAASRTLPLGSRAKVTNLETGDSVHVRINDRGPYARNRILDVSSKAAEHLGMKADGTAQVKVQPVPAPQRPRNVPPTDPR